MISKLRLHVEGGQSPSYHYEVTWTDLDNCTHVNVFASGPAARLFQDCIDDASVENGPAPLTKPKAKQAVATPNSRPILFSMGMPSAATYDRMIDVSDLMLSEALERRRVRNVR